MCCQSHHISNDLFRTVGSRLVSIASVYAALHRITPPPKAYPQPAQPYASTGKTEAAKLCIRFICESSKMRQSSSSSTPVIDHISRMISQTAPVLEALGNARTVHNHNSSRYGKYIDVHFSANSEVFHHSAL